MSVSSQNSPKIYVNKYQEHLISIIQKRYRSLSQKCLQISTNIMHYENLFQKISQHTENIYQESLITKELYEKIMEELDSLYHAFNGLPTFPITVRSLLSINESIINQHLNWIHESILKIVEKIGSRFLSDILYLYFGNNYIHSLSTEYLSYVHFLEKTFVSYKVEWLDGTIERTTPVSIKKSLSDSFLANQNSPQSNNSTFNEIKEIPDESEQDLEHLLKIIRGNNNNKNTDSDFHIAMDIAKQQNASLDLPFCTKNYPPQTKNLLERIEGTILYLPYKKKLLKITGYFLIDSLNQIKNNKYWIHKWNDINDLLPHIMAPDDFKQNYLEQLSLRDLISLSVKEITIKIRNQWEELQRIKSKPLALLVKEFGQSTLEKQRQIILLLLLDDNEDSNLLAHVLYDLIVNQSYLLKSVDHADQIYRSFHWSIKKKMNIIFKNTNKIVEKLKNLNESDVSYEKRIALLHTSDKVKQKALDKLKEMNGSRESSVKAQQYLDGLLRIPFGTYQREWILSFLDEFRQNLKTTMNVIFKKKEDIHDPNLYIFINDLENFWNNETFETEIEISKCMRFIEEKYQEFFTNSPEIYIKDIDDQISDHSESSSNDSENYEKLRQLSEHKLKRVMNIREALIKNNSQNNNTLERLDNELEQIQKMLVEYNNRKYHKNKSSIDIEKELKELIDLINEWKNYLVKRREYLMEVRETLDEAVYGQEKTKKQVESLISQFINGKSQGCVIGLVGPPGVGKTSIAKNGIAKALKDKDGKSRPFYYLPLGGATNGSVLIGHNYTYIGSSWGKISDMLMETSTMNPILFIDEAEKISQTSHGEEISNILIHLTDFTTNHEFHDQYFSGIPLDLSKCMIILSYNDASKLNRVLRDRITEIHVDSLTEKEKIKIAKDYLMPEILKDLGYKLCDFMIDDDTFQFLIRNYTYEAGARRLKEKLTEILREFNRRRMMGLFEYEFPKKITTDEIEEILETKVQIEQIDQVSRVGMINGLYATGMGIGGILKIECQKSYFANKQSLELTGNLHDVMKESMKVSREVAFGLLTDDQRKDIQKDWKDNGEWGLHIHCPEGATPKDGPSAGMCITLCILSVLLNKKISNTCAATGEIRMSGPGRISKIGGLSSKLAGARAAGVKKVLIPSDNHDDYIKYVKECEKNGDDIGLEVIEISYVHEAIEHFLE